MKRQILSAALFTTALVIPVLAVGAFKLPSTAKKLTGAEITALYDGATIAWHNKSSMTGIAKLDLKKGTETSTWESGGKNGTITGKIRVKGDLWCYKVEKNKEVCDSVYVDGQDIYEVDAKGVVDSLNKKH